MNVFEYTSLHNLSYYTRQQGSLGHIVITENEVEDILKFLDISKASGPDAVSPRLLKEATQILKSTLCNDFITFQYCLLPRDSEAMFDHNFIK
jgi:hypothetical protein